MLWSVSCSVIMETSDQEFWDQRYRGGKIPWDLGRSPAQLTRFVESSGLTPGRVLIPGCGSGYEVRTFAEHGWQVTAVDSSKAAIKRAKRLLGDYGLLVMESDFFDPTKLKGVFDLLYERTFLCSLHPQSWPLYFERVTNLLRSDGYLLGYFFFGPEDSPPPFPLSVNDISTFFSPRFSLREDRPVEDSLPLFENKERWQVWQRKTSVND